MGRKTLVRFTASKRDMVKAMGRTKAVVDAVANVMDIAFVRLVNNNNKLRDLAGEVSMEISAEILEILDGYEKLTDAIHSASSALSGNGRPGGDSPVEQAPEQDGKGSVEVAG